MTDILIHYATRCGQLQAALRSAEIVLEIYALAEGVPAFARVRIEQEIAEINALLANNEREDTERLGSLVLAALPDRRAA